MTKLTGVAPSPAALFRHTHQRKKDSSWVDKRSEAIYDNYNRSMEEMTQISSEQGTPPPNELDVWRDTAGVKKGRIYGLGLESTTLFERPSSSSSSCEWETHDRINNMKLKRMEEEMQELKAERDEARAERDEFKAKFAVYDMQFKQIMDRLSLQQNQDQGKKKGVEEEHDDDEEGNEEDLDDEDDQ